MIKLKHNKKRNTAFLYEALVRELTKAVMKQDMDSKRKVVEVIKEFFSKSEILAKELELYRTLSETSNLRIHVAEKMLFEAKRAYSCLDKTRIYEAQSSLIKTINQKISKNVFSNFVPNYKNIATIAQLFDDGDQPVKQKIILEQKIIDSLVSRETKDESKNMKPIGNVVYRTFVKKFNSTYHDLSEGQQKLLNRYVSSFGEGDLEFKIYLNEELGKIKTSLDSLIEEDRDIEDNTRIGIKDVLQMVENFKNVQISHEMLSKIMKIQGLIKELQK